MPFHFQFRRYHLPLRTVVRTAHEAWTHRDGILVRLEDSDGRVGWGEIAPIPAFGTETLEQAEAACLTLGEWPTAEQLGAVPRRLGCVRRALHCARAATTVDPSATNAAIVPAAGTSAYRAVAALLPAGRAALAQLPVKADAGFRVFKWKVAVGDLADELGVLDDLCAALPNGAKLRLDANGGWDRRQAERWLDRCADRPIEYVEQPCFAGAGAGETAVRRAEDILLGLTEDFPTPLALDESMVGEDDVTRWIGSGWRGWYVIKPTLLGNLPDALEQLGRAKATVVFSSALETAVGARAALQEAFAWPGEPKALGFGVWPLFSDSRFDGPMAMAALHVDDVTRLNPEAVWNALS